MLKAPSAWHDTDIVADLANSLAEDVLRMVGRTWDPNTSREAAVTLKTEAA